MYARLQAGPPRRHFLQHSLLSAGPDWTKFNSCLRRKKEDGGGLGGGGGGGGGGMTSVATERQEPAADSIGEGATALMYACQQSREQEARAILLKKPNRQSAESSALWALSSTEVLHRGPRPGAARERDRTLKTALHYCAEAADTACAELLLARAPDLAAAADEDGYTPLHLAVIAGNSALLRLLLARGADVNSLDGERHSVVHWATVCGEVEALELVLEAGAAPSTPDIHGGYPVHYAAQMCGPNSEMGNDARFGLLVLRALLARGVDVSVRDRDGRQPILWAASAGSADAILALVNAGADVEADDKDGLTALHCAASRGHTDCVETLVSLCGAETDVIDSNGCTALFYAATLGHADCTQLLLAYGAEPNRQDRKGRTPAHCGAAKGQLETLRILGAHGADLWLRNARGDYPLHEAVASGRKELVRWLLAQRPDAVNAPNNDGRCPLHVAAVNNNVEMCKIILDGQALLNPVMRTAKGHLMTPLDAALYRGNRGCAKYLQLHGGVPANKLTDRTASVRGGAHRERAAASESRSEQFTTPECGAPGRISAVSSPLADRRLLAEALDRSHALQVRLNEDVAIRHIERLDGPIVCHHYCGDSSEEDRRRWRRRRRRRRRRGDAVEDEEAPRRRRRDETGDGRRRRRRRLKSGSSSSDRKTRDSECSSGEEEERAAADSDSAGDSGGTGRRRGRAQREEQGSDVEYVTVKKTTIKTKKTTLKSKTDEEEAKEALEAGSRADVENEKLGLEVEDSLVERSESREREVIKKTVKSSTVKEKKDKGKPKETVTKGKEKREMAVKEEQKGTVRGKRETAIGSASKKVKDKGSTKQTPKGDSVKQIADEKVVKKNAEVASAELPTLAHSSAEELTSRTHTPYLNDQEGGQITHTVVTAIVHQHDVMEVAVQQQVGENHPSEEKDEDDYQGEEEQPSEVKEDDDCQGEEEQASEVKEDDDCQGEEEQPSEVKEDDKHQGDEKKLSNEKEYIDENAVEYVKSAKEESDFEKDVDAPDHAVRRGEDATPEASEMEILEKDAKPAKIEVEEPASSQAAVEEGEPSRAPADVSVETGEPSGDATSGGDAKPACEQVSGKNETEVSDDHGGQENEEVLEERGKFTPEREAGTPDVSGPAEAAACEPEDRSVAEEVSIQEEDRTQVSVKAGEVHTDDEAQELERDEEEEATASLADREKAASVETTTRTTVTSSPTSRGEDSSMLMDSGFEPSPRREKDQRRGRVPRLCRTGKDEQGPPITATSVTRAVQNSMRKYHLERQIFQELLELKRLQIRAGRANEQVLVKRLADEFAKTGVDFGPKPYEGPYNFRTFEKYLYDQLRLLQTADRGLVPRLRSSDDLEKLSSVLRKARFTNRLRGDPPDDPALCTHGTHRCHHAAHAYTGVPCAAYITKLNHHHVAKGPAAARGGFLPRIDPGLPRGLRYVDPSRPVTLELSRGADRQVVSLPTERLDRNKRYYVTFTIKGGGKEEAAARDGDGGRHRHAESL
ncbi:uncharacterized protein LOC134536319 [Bacillus rossius redtenbacheri]|uniref:uncharacterized protein LOC134536319 n=1 Tax=Bacillus rossius redtenbacheri TaxID=93214 RepID=UPI002FDDDD5D